MAAGKHMEITQDTSLHDCCGGIIWETSFALSQYLRLHLPHRTAGRKLSELKVVELGAGTNPQHRGGSPAASTAAEKWRIVTVGISGGRSLTRGCFATPIPLDRIVARTHMYTFDPDVWDLFLVAPCQT